MLDASVLVVLLAGVYLIGLLFWQIARVTHIVAGGTRWRWDASFRGVASTQCCRRARRRWADADVLRRLITSKSCTRSSTNWPAERPQVIHQTHRRRNSSYFQAVRPMQLFAETVFAVFCSALALQPGPLRLGPAMPRRRREYHTVPRRNELIIRGVAFVFGLIAWIDVVMTVTGRPRILHW